jgi:GntR family transcriptional regulator/MocR family aminotransferase
MSVLVRLDRSAGGLGLQLERGLRQRIQSGVLAPGAALPSTRELAERLGLSRGLVLAAYAQLLAEGYVVARRGSGTRVAPRAGHSGPSPSHDATRRTRTGRRIRYDFMPGVPDVRLFPRRAWLRCLRRGLERSATVLEYPHPAGLPAAREALTEYLNRSRATVTLPSSLVICTGFAQAARIMAAVLLERGIRRIGVEDPGHIFRGDGLAGSGLDVVPIPVDDDGMVVEALGRARVDAVLVTPAHHYPTGSVLSARRRSALLEWAAGGRLILEDDYDGEYRYDRDPVGALQGLAPELVVYLGSGSKMLAPGLRLGWIALPAALAPIATRIKRRFDLGSPVQDQLALSEFIRTGELDKHLRRTRVVFRKRRDTLVESLRSALPALPIRGAPAGLHLMLPLPPGADEAEVLAACTRRGVRVGGAQAHYLEPDRATPGLVVGFGAISREDVAAGAGLIAAAVQSG